MILRSLAALMLSAAAVQAGPPQVVATFSIIGDRIDLQVLLGPDADAHLYEPRPRDAIVVARADGVLTFELELEGFVDRLIAASGTDAAIIALTDGADVLEDPAGGHFHYVGDEAIWHAGAHDPHVCQSVPSAQAYVATIADAVCAADAEGCEVYRANAARYAEDLDALDAEFRTAIGALPEDRRTVVVAHNAFRYFKEEYGIVFLSPQGLSTDSEASAADVAGLICKIFDRKAGAILAENISDIRLVDRIAAETGMDLAGTLCSDALSGPDGPAPDYLSMMRHTARAITAALAAD
ncbi:metal ABC transporter substrate-binding protein [Paracoccus liaowanqingii]|uniref:Metal ABC transporter substrate-binding protein n=2 Tax=Paracoccus liaowanqingii TaxID=2560053 RepID=A0A4P7HRP9_9RHOB|nr:metal ABC transporter substrate-binding protein [Paracoccus liaowanqingii]